MWRLYGVRCVCGLFTGMRACAQKIVAKFDKGSNPNGKINMDELREILTDLDKDKHPPLPKDLL